MLKRRRAGGQAAEAVSAGGVVVRRAERSGPPEVLVLSGDGGRVRNLPKGVIEEGESPGLAAVREVREEGGVDAEIVGELPSIDYWFFWGPDRTRYHKTVHFFLMRYLSGDTADHDDEAEAAEWMSADAAVEALTYPKERETVRRALALLARQETGEWTAT